MSKSLLGVTTPQEALGQVIKEFKLNASELARKSDLTRQQISAYKKGVRGLHMDSWLKLVTALPTEARQRYLELLFPANNPTTTPSPFYTDAIQQLSHRAAEIEATYKAFTQELSELSQSVNFTKFIHLWLAENKISLDEFRLLLQQRSDMNMEALEDLLNGQRSPNELELGYLGTVLVKPNGEPFSLTQLKQIREGKPYKQILEECNDTHRNGVH